MTVIHTHKTGNPKLTPAEKEVITELCKGKYLTTVARERGTSLRTCEHQVLSIRDKIGANNMHHACVIWTDAKHEGVEL